MLRRMYFVFALITASISFASLPTAAQSGRAFYIDYGNGSNTNNGTSKSTPWKTHPYMQTGSACTGTGSAPSYTHAAGDRFIFKGGVTWPAACFGMAISNGGLSGTPDYYGVDQTWYSGGSFTRPIFGLAGVAPVAAGPVGGRNVIVVTANYVTVDYLEISGQYIIGGHSGPNMGYDCGIYFSGVSGTVSNGYFHDWVSNAANINAGYSNCAGGVGVDGGSLTVDRTEVGDAAGTPLPFGSCFGNPSEVKNSKCHDVGQGVNGFSSVHDSEFYNISNASTVSPYTNGIHTNIIQQTWPGGSGAVYNNLIHDSNPGQMIGVCPTTNVYNNVIWHLYGGGGTGDILVDTGVNACTVNTGTVANVYNNTINCIGMQACVAITRAGYTIGTVNIKNNVFITDGSVGDGTIFRQATVTSYNASNNYTMTTSEAAQYGFTSTNKLSPASSDPNVTNAGVNLTTSCGGYLAAICQDTSGAPWYGGSYAARPSGTAAWDAGAYEFGGQSQSSNPSPPTSLAALVQ